MTAANIVTLIRLALIPFILWLSYARSLSGIITAAALFALAGASDWLDGFLARRLSAVSSFGKLLDPLVDKMLILGALFVFTRLGLIPDWIFLLNLARELVVTGARHHLSTPGHAVGANWMGKTKFCLQIVVVSLAYLHLIFQAAGRPLPAGEHLVLGSAVLMTAISCLFLACFIRTHAAELFAGLATPSHEA